MSLRSRGGFFGPRLAMLVAVVVLAGSVGAPVADASSGVRVDRVVVVKSERQLYLMADGEVVESFPVGLGPNPVGHKYFSGDGRTPEGTYTLVQRNQHSGYYRSIRVSYPNAEDHARSTGYGLAPGGAIMIHGEPNDPAKARRLLDRRDWTEGCIAVSNAAMAEIWALVEEGTPIDIIP